MDRLLAVRATVRFRVHSGESPACYSSWQDVAAIFVCLAGILGVVLISERHGRGAGLAVSALFSAFAAFFVMPPALSFRIERPGDLGILVGFALSSLAILHLFRRAESQDVLSSAGLMLPVPPRMDAEVLSIALPQSRLANEPDYDPDVSGVIEDVRGLAKETAPSIDQIFVHSALQPGLRKFWVIARRRADVATQTPLIIGLRDEHCQRITRPAWPANCSVAWFDNDAERVYQISVRL